MTKYIVSVLIALLVGLGLGYSLPHKSATLGGTVENYPVWFLNGINAGTSKQFAVTSTGGLTAGSLTTSGSLSAGSYATASVGISSSSPAALGSAASGHFIVAAGATTASASTTVVTANSDIQLQLEATTPIAGTTCNSSINSSSTPIITSKVAGNGFTITIPSAPVTNPFCYSYSISN